MLTSIDTKRWITFSPPSIGLKHIYRTSEKRYTKDINKVEDTMDDKDSTKQTTVQPSKPPVSKDPVPPVSGPLAGLEKWLYDVLVTKAPYTLPKAAADWIAKYAPWLTLVVGVLLLFSIFSLWQVLSYTNSVLSAYAAYVGHPVGMSVWFWPAFIVLVIQVVVMLVSVPMLLKQQRKGWLFVFYADLVSVVYGVLNAILYSSFGSLLMTLVAAVIGLYVLFQIRRYYTK